MQGRGWSGFLQVGGVRGESVRTGETSGLREDSGEKHRGMGGRPRERSIKRVAKAKACPGDQFFGRCLPMRGPWPEVGEATLDSLEDGEYDGWEGELPCGDVKKANSLYAGMEKLKKKEKVGDRKKKISRDGNLGRLWICSWLKNPLLIPEVGVKSSEVILQEEAGKKVIGVDSPTDSRVFRFCLREIWIRGPNFFRPFSAPRRKPISLCSSRISHVRAVAPKLAHKALAVSGLMSGGDSETDAELEQNNLNRDATIDLQLPRRNLLVKFTCDLCNERKSKLVNRLAYEKGLIYVQCAGCLKYHKLVDNLWPCS
ncbi:hypothetical protein ACLB2K_039278 [Fragaria x ananassa]